MHIYEDASLSVGNTPLVKIRNLSSHAHLYAKTESRNPANSVKCRIGANMIWQAEQDGTLKPGMEIVEATSGNTGIALAFVGAARGYKVTLVMPDSMSIERRKIMQALGANLLLTEGAKGMQGAVDKAEELAKDANVLLMRQFENPANPAAHERTTGVELYNDLDGKVDILVAGVGTGGTITGCSRYLKNTRGVDLLSVAVEPADSPLITQLKSGAPLKPAGHKIQGLGANFIPKNLDVDLVDVVETVGNDEAIAMAHQIMQQEGILAGISSGAAMVAALRHANNPANADKNIVVVLPDSGERYLTSALFAGRYED